jgi:argininosuccinate synthase
LADRIVVGYFGDRGSLAVIVSAAAARGMDVVVVAFDLGGQVSLTALRDDALALGAVRCHAMDVREDFAREVLIPALSANVDDPSSRIDDLAAGFVRQALKSIAALETAAMIEPDGVAVPWTARPAGLHAAGVASISLRFVDRSPVELNGIPMTLVEILESLETIARHPAADVLRAAYRDLESSDGIVELGVEHGAIHVASALVAC